MQTQLFKCGKSEPDSIDVLRLKYQLMGKKNGGLSWKNV